MKLKYIILFILIILISCSGEKPRPIGEITNIYVAPHGGLGRFSQIFIYLEINDSLFFKKVNQNEIDKIEINNIAGFDYERDKIIETIIDTMSVSNRFMLLVRTHMEVVNKIMQQNEILDSTSGINVLYGIDVNNTSVHIEAKDLYWDFEAVDYDEHRCASRRKTLSHRFQTHSVAP